MVAEIYCMERFFPIQVDLDLDKVLLVRLKVCLPVL